LCLWPLILAGCPANNAAPSQNNPPAASAGADQVVDAGATVTLDGSASSDPDGDAISFSWKQILGAPVSLSSSTAPLVTFTAPSSNTTLTFELTISDGQSESVARTSVLVRVADAMVKVEERRQRSVTDDPAVLGEFPKGWRVETPAEATGPPPDESEIGEFGEQYEEHHVRFVPAIEEDLAPGATRTLELQIASPARLGGLVQWVGTLDPLEVFVSLEDSSVPGIPYHIGKDRGGSLVVIETLRGGLARLSATNTSAVTVKVRMVLASGVPSAE
jgi:hypothetical protein